MDKLSLVARLQAFCLAASNRKRLTERSIEFGITLITTFLVLSPFLTALLIVAMAQQWKNEGELSLGGMLFLGTLVVIAVSLQTVSERMFSRQRDEIEQLAEVYRSKIPLGREGAVLILMSYFAILGIALWLTTLLT